MGVAYELRIENVNDSQVKSIVELLEKGAIDSHLNHTGLDIALTSSVSLDNIKEVIRCICQV